MGAQGWRGRPVRADEQGSDQFSGSGRTAEVACRLGSAGVGGCAEDELVGGDIEGGCLIKIGPFRDVEVDKDPLYWSWRWWHRAVNVDWPDRCAAGASGGHGSRALPGRRVLAVPCDLAEGAEHAAGCIHLGGDLCNRIRAVAAGVVG
jgi:hypothetical protein